MRVAALVSSGLQAALLEEAVSKHPEAGVELVWVALEPRGILAALDHDPHVFLLDMRWRHQALEAAELLRQFGMPLMMALFESMDDPLIPDARALGLEVFVWGSPLRMLLQRIGAAG